MQVARNASSQLPLDGTPLVRVDVTTIAQERHTSGSLWWKKETIVPATYEWSGLVDPMGTSDSLPFTGSLDDAIAAVRTLNKDEGFRNPAFETGKQTTDRGYWEGGEKFADNAVRAILAGDRPDQWRIVTTALHGNGSSVPFELDGRAGSGDEYRVTARFHDAIEGLAALVDQNAVVRFTDRTATHETTGRYYQPAKWVVVSGQFDDGFGI